VKRSRAQASIAFATLSSRGPLHRCSAPAVHSQHLRLRVCAFGPLVPTSRSRSAHVVSHHLDGFLRPHSVGLLHPTADPGVHRVASIRPPAPADSEEPTNQHAWVVSRDALTPRRYFLPAAPPRLTATFPKDRASHRGAAPLPLCDMAPMPTPLRKRGSVLIRVFSTPPSTSGLCSTDRSVAAVCRFQQPTTLFSHGLLLLYSTTPAPRTRMAP
jgi:hypothetical protein